MSITVYGIANCDTVKRARAWLAERSADFSFHDFKKAGLAPELLDAWIAALGWEPLLNRKGTTWRGLPEAERAAVIDAASARALMLANTSLVKRPVVAWADGAVTVGFDAKTWSERI